MAKIKDIIQDVIETKKTEVELKTIEALDIKVALDEVATRYSESKATTNAGWFLRLVSRFIKPSTVIKLFSHKLSK
jgi:hypothetical protein